MSREPLDNTAPKRSTKRTLPERPDRNASVPELGEWLTTAIAPRPGARVSRFVRYGRDDDDACLIEVLTPGETPVSWKFPRQGRLRSPQSLRTTLAGVTDGFFLMPPLSKTECEDVWITLCRLAIVLLEHDEAHEAADWLLECLGEAELQRLSFEPAHVEDSLRVLRSQPGFSKAAAEALRDPRSVVAPEQRRRPRLLEDPHVTGRRWLIATELEAFVRYTIGLNAPLAPRTLQGRMTQLGVAVEFYEKRRPVHMRRTLFRLPVDYANVDPTPLPPGGGG
jgi:hypothetical protein